MEKNGMEKGINTNNEIIYEIKEGRGLIEEW